MARNYLQARFHRLISTIISVMFVMYLILLRRPDYTDYTGPSLVSEARIQAGIEAKCRSYLEENEDTINDPVVMSIIARDVLRGRNWTRPWRNRAAQYRLPIDKINKNAVRGGINNYLKNYKNPCWFEGSVSVNGIRCLPYFYLLGVAKSGTTFLFRNLIRHPDIAAPVEKELFYWSYIGRRVKLEEYIAKLNNASIYIYNNKEIGETGAEFHNKITFDGTPNYFTDHGNLISMPCNNNHSEPIFTLAESLYQLYPRTKLIVTLRNPIDRLYSHYHHFNAKKGFSPQDFHRRVITNLQLLNTCIEAHSFKSCMFNSTLLLTFWQTGKVMLHYSIYYPYAVEWLKVFPQKQIMMLKAEELYVNATDVMENVFTFLGVDPTPYETMDEILAELIDRRIEDHFYTSYRQEATMLNETRSILETFFKPFNRQLAQLLKHDKFLFQ